MLRNVLKLEQQRGYDDRAVVGGLSAMVQRLGAALGLTSPLLGQIESYARESTAKREQIVDELAALLSNTSKGETAPSRTPPREGEGRVPPPPLRGTLRLGGASRAIAQMTPGTQLAQLPGVGPTRAKRLATLGLLSAGDLLLHFPNRYLFYPPPAPASHLGFQELASFEGVVSQLYESRLPGNRRRISVVIRDATGSVGATWIRGGRFPIGIHEGMRLAVSGPLVRYGRQLTFENPDFEPADRPPLHTRRAVPVYPLTAGISQLFLRGLVRDALTQIPLPTDVLPAWLLENEQLMARAPAIAEIHAPSSAESLEQARFRLAFEELLPVQLLALERRRRYQSEPAPAIDVPWPLLAEVRRNLPFSLTGAQQRVLSTLLDEIAQRRPMVRLLQGDVGSGKTVVAAMALLSAVASGFQAALLAPTEILAEQHFRTLTALFEGAQEIATQALGHGIRLRLLTGALSSRDRSRLVAEIRAGEADVIIGTHAIIQEDVEFASLAIAVVDEQHRFGVEQRGALRLKGENPHLLVMTATPIPRTLALTAYGDLDISFIDELPPGRQPVDTILLNPDERWRAYQKVRSEVEAGHQAFVICPLVEGSVVIEARAATSEHARLQENELAGLRLALLHGRMRPTAKDQVMRDFGEGRYDVLVSTPVVEVGVDIPNATVMLIEGAERFGLAQLHQFRGRIGRGSSPAYCYCVAGGDSAEPLARLETLAASHNGLELAEADLRMRGPGDYSGLRQSGFPSLRLADITDLDFVQRVRAAAERLLAVDPDLSQPEQSRLLAAVRELEDTVREAN